ncbi:MAG: tetratricopeptide repeat protein [Pirellulales bacterium]
MNDSQVSTDEAVALYRQGRLQEAELLCRRVLAANSRFAPAHRLMSGLAERANRLEEAERYARLATECSPNEPTGWNQLAVVLMQRSAHAEARQALQEALRIQPDYVIGYNNLGEVLKSLGLIVEASDAYRKAIEIEPDFAAARSNFLISLLYRSDLGPHDIADEHRLLARWWSEKYPAIPAHSNTPDADRRLKVGYVSPDFREHAVSRFFEPLLASHDRDRFELFLYSECPIVDAVGDRLRQFGDHWRCTWNVPTKQVVEQIQQDGVDILVDLSGHTRNNRLDVFAMRPAPVQVTYLGYPSITGLETIDYRFTDSQLDPDNGGSEVVSTEKLVRLSHGYANFQPPLDAPEVVNVPSRHRGYVCLGSHHPIVKLHDGLLNCWVQLLQRLPTARLVFFRSELTGDVAGQLHALLDRHGFPMDRVEVRAVSATPADYLRQYADIDIILDSFPHNGHTMTCEALWMGVPVVTLRGDRPAGRLSSSVLHSLGLFELVAATPEEYLQTVVELAGDEPRRIALRQRLRGLLQEQAERKQWIRGFEGALQDVWRTWCDDRAVHSSSAAALPPNDIPSASELSSLGLQHERAGRIDDALTCYEAASRQEPWIAEYPLQMGNLYTATHRFAEAERSYRGAVAVEPTCFPAWAMLGQNLADQGHLERANHAFDRALSVEPRNKLKILRACLLPHIYPSQESVAEYRQKLTEGLRELHDEGVTVDPSREIVPNFFLLAYQGGDVLDLQKSFADFFQPPEGYRQCPKRSGSAGRRIRVGILSEYFCNHTIGTLNRGLVEHLDRKRFEVTVVSLSAAQDETAQRYRRCADHFVTVGSDLPRTIETVRELQLDILCFADIGMSCMGLTLACLRFAPVQCVIWGHPLTTGLPTIDYFLSGQLYETPDADLHYTERLVRLSGLQTCYPRPELSAPKGREHFGLPVDANLYGCLQTLFKFHPDFDAVLAGILRRDPHGLLVLLEGRHASWQASLMQRWAETMPDVIDRIRFMPAVPRHVFLALCETVDVLLDTIQFGGGNTTFEALAVGTPVVTWPSPYLRSRLALGIYRHIDWLECVADSVDNYIDIAVRLGTNPTARHEAKKALVEHSEGLFENVASVHAFEQFFQQAFEGSCDG